MPGLFHQRSLSNITSISSVSAERFKSLKPNYSCDPTCSHQKHPPKTPHSPPGSTMVNADSSQSSERIKMDEDISSKPICTSRRVNAVAYPSQDRPRIGSSESESDLAAMVHEFLENESYFEAHDGSESDGGLPSPSKLCEDLQALTSALAPMEKRILALLRRIVRSIDEQRDFVCLDEGSECKGSCVRQIVVKNFRRMGYNAAICKAKWHNTEIFIKGEYEYIDLLLDGDRVLEKDRLVIDLDFKSQFEIARPTQHYLTALNLLPTMFVGSSEKLYQVLQIMSEAARCSLKQNSMYLPPWRTLDYMCAKWFSPCERIIDNLRSGTLQGRAPFSSCSGTKQCLELLRRMRTSLPIDSERGFSFSSGIHKTKGVNKFSRIKTSNLLF
ncbi:hypothetical protein O6H91_03G115800 [Diphasiastrum complanatum]|uniref:Uncharacterized protein n=7 Tax=Diphasiastrum complanatum TaxID=34168 RepID=A0ACC2EAD2_DIPCM|nr:hypothetical protein O6H91_03G115800 [Diphasiastrum complanatum]KAJ7563579.1 hypothetical protein O6H91_03G115800 [Diphasiastrum complanatum]KAJ7563580.1 hypothetical protein O6H91_03G115800 [Diphasiastrum complanatum]KAJ7563581.1 hypothetical protein O6H91_03G115800 [Diphasiastrum complanatum]KAJ7563582.1 hypothetical protein O6H91_03G115800 [Diphasiastrum complanatum]